MNYKKLLWLLGGVCFLFMLFLFLPWHIVLVVFVPFAISFAWQLMKPSQTKITKRKSLQESFSRKSTPVFYEQGYRAQIPPKSAHRFPFARNIAEPKQDPPGAIYEKPQVQYIAQEVENDSMS